MRALIQLIFELVSVKTCFLQTLTSSYLHHTRWSVPERMALSRLVPFIVSVWLAPFFFSAIGV